MKIEKRKIRPVLEVPICDCGKEMKIINAEMEKQPQLVGVPQTKPPKIIYTYKCECGKEEKSDIQYPRVKYEW